MEHGDFFSGNLTRTTISPMLIPSRYLRVSGSYQTVQVRLDEGSFTTRITEARLDASLSPDVSWRNLAQYDTDSKDLTLQTRLRWILAPGQDLFLLGVYGWNRVRHRRATDPDHPGPDGQARLHGAVLATPRLINSTSPAAELPRTTRSAPACSS